MYEIFVMILTTLGPLELEAEGELVFEGLTTFPLSNSCTIPNIFPVPSDIKFTMKFLKNYIIRADHFAS